MRKGTFLAKYGFLGLFGSIFIVTFSLFTNAKGFNLHGINTLSDTPTGVIRALEVVDNTIFVAAENGLFKVIGGKSTRLALGGDDFSGIISSVFHDNEGSLWISEYGVGVYRYDLVRGTIELIDSDIDTSHIWELVASENELVLSSIDEVIILDKLTYKSLGWNKYTPVISQVYSMSLLGNSQVVASNEDSILVIDLVAKTAEHLLLNQHFPLIERASVVAYYGSYIYVGGDSGVYRFSDLKRDKEFFSFSSVSEPSRDIDSIFEDRNGNIWLAAGGLFQFSGDEIVPVNWLNPLLYDDAIRSILAIKETQSGNLLLASSQLGIVTLSDFHNSLNYVHRQEGLFQDNIENVYNHRDEYAFIKSNDNTYKLDLTSGELSLLDVGTYLDRELTSSYCTDSLEFKVNELLEQSEITTQYCKSEYNHIVTIAPDKFYVYVYSPGSSTYFLVENGVVIDQIAAPDLVVRSLLSSAGELVGHDVYDNIFIQLSNRAWKKMSYQDFGWKGITCLLESASDFLVCTSGSGVVSINKISGEVRRNNVVNQEQLRFIRSGLVLGDYLWLATNKGLYLSSLDGTIQRKLDHSDGVFDVDFEYAGIRLLGEKLLIMGDRYNYLIEHTSAIEAVLAMDKKNPEVELFQLTVKDHSGNTSTISTNSETIQITSDVFSLNATVSSSDFLKHHHQKVQFNVLNYIDTWQTLDKSYGSISLSGLDYGEYHLSLRVIDSLTGRAFEQNVLPINVVPPFYLRNGAYVFYVLLVLALIWRTQKLRSLILTKLVAEVNILRRFRQGELKSNQDKIESLMYDKAKVFSELSHELRTPLHLISGVIKRVEGEQSLISPDTKTILMRNVQRLESLTDQMVQLEKIGIAEPNNQNLYDVDHELKFLVASLEPLTKAKKQTFQCRLASKASVRLIAGSLEHIVSNLATNAVKYSSEYSTIKINTSSNEQEVRITIADSGIGIDPKHHQDIFKRFSRVNDNTNPDGDGIGLALVKELVTVNRGTISVESKLGAGAKFTVRFPVEADETEIEGIDDTTIVQDLSQTVLIVEDNLDLRGYLFDLLKTTYKCLTAKTGTHALDVLGHYKPDLVITDYYMPDMNGISLARELKKRAQHTHTPVILLTATTSEELTSQAYEAKIDCVLQKPISDDELKSRVSHLLSIREHFKRPQNEADIAKSGPPSYLKIPDFNNEKDLNFYLKFIAVLEKNYKDETFNRAQAADQMLISIRQLNRRLSDLFEYNFSEFLSRFRIDKAVKALDKGGSIMDLSLDVGFGTPTYFSTTFKRVTGLPPKKFQDAFFGTHTIKNKA